MLKHHMTLETLEGELSRINDRVAECKALLELEEMVKKQGNNIYYVGAIARHHNCPKQLRTESLIRSTNIYVMEHHPLAILSHILEQQ